MVRKHLPQIVTIAMTTIVVSILWLTAIKVQAWRVEIDALNIFFVLTTFVSLAFNLVQWHDRKLLLLPVRNPLIGLFNDLKGRQQRCWNKWQRLNQTTTLQEFHDFIDEMLQGLDQAREHVLAVIETVAPNLADKEFFRASLRGLTDEEKEDRAEWRRNRRQELDREERRAQSRTIRMMQPKGLSRSYAGDLVAYIYRRVASDEYDWSVENTKDKVVIADGTAATLQRAQNDGDAAATQTPLNEWHTYPSNAGGGGTKR